MKWLLVLTLVGCASPQAPERPAELIGTWDFVAGQVVITPTGLDLVTKRTLPGMQKYQEDEHTKYTGWKVRTDSVGRAQLCGFNQGVGDISCWPIKQSGDTLRLMRYGDFDTYTRLPTK